MPNNSPVLDALIQLLDPKRQRPQPLCLTMSSSSSSVNRPKLLPRTIASCRFFTSSLLYICRTYHFTVLVAKVSCSAIWRFVLPRPMQFITSCSRGVRGCARGLSNVSRLSMGALYMIPSRFPPFFPPGGWVTAKTDSAKMGAGSSQVEPLNQPAAVVEQPDYAQVFCRTQHPQCRPANTPRIGIHYPIMPGCAAPADALGTQHDHRRQDLLPLCRP